MISMFPVSGACAPKIPGAEPDRPEDLVHQRELHLAVPLAAELRAEVARPEVVVLHDLLELLAALHELGEVDRARRQQCLERLDLLADELVDPVELLLELGVGLEIPGHGDPLSRCARGPRSPGGHLIRGSSQRGSGAEDNSSG